METVNSSFEKSDTILSVTLCNSSLLKEGEHIGKVTRNTVSLGNLIAEIAEYNTGIDPFIIQHSAVLLKKQILRMLHQGKCVNILDLGVMYIGLKGPVKGSNPDVTDIPEMVVRFTPSQAANDAIKDITVDKIVFSDTSPQIDTVTDVWTKNQNSVLTAGKLCRITGKKLKLGGDDYALSLVKVDSFGKEVTDSAAINVDISKFSKNTTGTLEFFIPDQLENNAPYKIRIKTSYSGSAGSKVSRKTPVTSESIPLLAVA